ncbi:MAG TPA: hypothetical protein VHZ95_11040, partial [Polyangiales bacterium]|nr:hypothetical protein [Polyangiales bacterium]
CLRRRLEGLHFAQPIEHAPLAVSGTMHLTRAPVATPAPAPVVVDASVAAQTNPDTVAMPLAATTPP